LLLLLLLHCKSGVPLEVQVQLSGVASQQLLSCNSTAVQYSSMKQHNISKLLASSRAITTAALLAHKS
jgi:hypothetical protein